MLRRSTVSWRVAVSRKSSATSIRNNKAMMMSLLRASKVISMKRRRKRAKSTVNLTGNPITTPRAVSRKTWVLVTCRIQSTSNRVIHPMILREMKRQMMRKWRTGSTKMRVRARESMPAMAARPMSTTPLKSQKPQRLRNKSNTRSQQWTRR